MPDVLSPPLAGQLPEVSTPYSSGHQAVDWPVRTGTPVLAAGTGVVIATPYQLTGGLMIHLDHGGGVETNYAHLSARFVSKGDKVKAGQQIGLSGSSGLVTGPHLHFGLRINGQWVDPMPYLVPGQVVRKDGPVTDPDAGLINLNLDIPDLVQPALNGAVVVVALLLAWAGLQKILGRD